MNTVKIACTQKDESGKILFSVVKESSTVNQVDNDNLSNFIINTLSLSCQLAKLTGTNKAKLSKSIEVEYTIGDIQSSLVLKFSLAEKRIQLIRGKMPAIFVTAYRMHTLAIDSTELFVNSRGIMVFKDAVKEIAAVEPVAETIAS